MQRVSEGYQEFAQAKYRWQRNRFRINSNMACDPGRHLQECPEFGLESAPQSAL